MPTRTTRASQYKLAGKTSITLSCPIRRLEKCPLMLRKIIFHLQPGKSALVIEMNLGFECCRISKGGGINMYGAGVMAGFKTKWRATSAAKITLYAG